MNSGWGQRLGDEVAQAWTVAVKDVRIYYLQPPMIMFGLLLPFFLFFSFAVKREIGAEVGLARLLALTTFFTASSAGPVIIPLERRTGTYDRLLAAPMSLATLLLGKTLVGAFFAVGVALVPLLVGWLGLRVVVAEPGLLVVAVVLGAGPGLPVATDLRPGPVEPCGVGLGLPARLAGPGSAAGPGRVLPDPGRPAAPAQPRAGPVMSG
jgi:hypothetical protein